MTIKGLPTKGSPIKGISKNSAFQMQYTITIQCAHAIIALET